MTRQTIQQKDIMKAARQTIQTSEKRLLEQQKAQINLAQLNQSLTQAAKQEQKLKKNKQIKPGQFIIQPENKVLYWEPIRGSYTVNHRGINGGKTFTGIHPDRVVAILIEKLGVKRDKIIGDGAGISGGGISVYLEDIPSIHRQQK